MGGRTVSDINSWMDSWEVAQERLKAAACGAHVDEGFGKHGADWNCPECVRRYFRNLIASDFVPRQELDSALAEIDRLRALVSPGPSSSTP